MANPALLAWPQEHLTVRLSVEGSHTGLFLQGPELQQVFRDAFEKAEQGTVKTETTYNPRRTYIGEFRRV